MKVGLVILAAGESSRMGSPKQLLPVFGVQMLKYLILEGFETICSPITVVLGANKDKIVPILKNMPIVIIDNPDWKSGLSSSIKVGLVGTYLADKTIDAVIFLASDMPFVNATVINDLIALAKTNSDKSIIASKYSGKYGIPILFKRETFEKLLDLKGDIGAKQILKDYDEDILGLDFSNGNIDLDTKEDYFKFLQSIN